ncbi:MAG: YeeE/YedE thiosulfate transporter family protein [Methanolinea sp.]|nr:YeeE/YedE thiosulfate transporter family protein [Methanolinea sp.]
MPFDGIRQNRTLQVLLGLAFGIIFGFLLQKGGVTLYDVMVGQFLLTDFSVLKVMLSAILVGMAGIHAMNAAGLVRLHVRAGSIGSTVIGGLIYGAGFAVLGYCPATAAGASGSGALDAAVGMAGIVIGAGIFARLYPVLERSVLNRGKFPAETIPQLLGVSPVPVACAVAIMILIILALLATMGL